MRHQPFKYQQFADTGLATCKIHGDHPEWKLRRPLKPSVECKRCHRARRRHHYLANPQKENARCHAWLKMDLLRHPLKHRLNTAERASRRCGRVFAINEKNILNLFQQQKELCALTGMPLTLQTLSIDRVDSAKGYLPDNIQLISAHINLMKLDHSQEDFILYCTQVATWNNRT